jgi:phosphoglycolate phosphatase
VRRAVLFDLDGTLSDPAVGIVAALRAALGATGVELATAGRLERFIGPPLQECFAELGLAPDGVAAAITAYRAYYAEVGLFENAVYPGVADLLASLEGDGFGLAVATSKPATFAVRILDHFGLLDRFEVVAGPELDGRNRHKHEVIALALAGLGAEPASAVMVGDRLHDVAGARHHGLVAVGVTWGYGTREELVAAGADHLVDTPAELGGLLRGGRGST